jgi:hypothetical protein
MRSVEQPDFRRNFDCGGMTPRGQGTWTCLETQANSWKCDGETGTGPGTWTWRLDDLTSRRWLATPPNPAGGPSPQCDAAGVSSSSITCNYHPSSTSPNVAVHYRWTGNPNTFEYSVDGDAGFGSATWKCQKPSHRVECDGQVGMTWLTSPMPLLYDPNM